MENDYKPQIPYLEAFFVGSYIAVIDLTEILLAFLLLDDFFIGDILAFPVIQIYLRMKGVKGTFSVIMNCLELIPYVGDLPLLSFGFWTVVWADHHPTGWIAKLIGAAQSATSVGNPGKAGIKK